MTLHIFNPEHDLALAANMGNFTPPKATLQLRRDLGFLPVFWADDGDLVLVEDIDYSANECLDEVKYLSKVQFVTIDLLESFVPQISAISPWGNDAALTYRLVERYPSLGKLLPDIALQAELRNISGRPWAAMQLLPKLTTVEGTVGRSEVVCNLDELESLLVSGNDFVLKAPWSSSGRGNRNWLSRCPDDGHMLGWCKNIIRKQGCLMVEPLYNKVLDFGMEFTMSPRHELRYDGVNLFYTENSVYRGSRLASESEKLDCIDHYVSMKCLELVKQVIYNVMQRVLVHRYVGPFGVDMMVVDVAERGASPLYRLHPMVELNLRRTMGHVALAVSAQAIGCGRKSMSVVYDGRYRLVID